MSTEAGPLQLDVLEQQRRPTFRCHRRKKPPMHGLSSTVDLSFFANRRLEQLRIGEHQLELVFGDGVSISVEAAISLADDDREDLPTAAKGLIDLLGCELAGAKSSGRGDLWLLFANGRRVIIHDSNDDYESYTITRPDGLIVV